MDTVTMMSKRGLSLSRIRSSAVHLILDWDGTLTKRDTLHYLGAIGFTHHKTVRKSRSDESDNVAAETDPPLPIDPWREVVELYSNDFKAHQQAYRPAKEHRRTIEEERVWLASLEEVENRSAKRVEQAGIFRGVTAEEIKAGAKHAAEVGGLQLREGWIQLFSSVLADDREKTKHSDNPQGTGNIISILSVHWSRTFIRESLLHAVATAQVRDEDERQLLEQSVRDTTIWANEIQGFDDPNGASGLLTNKDSRDIRIGRDKLRYMPHGVIPAENGRLEEDSDRGIVMYVGDSCTDFECLLDADVGICIRDDPMSDGQKELADTLERVGVDVHHISDLNSGTEERKSPLWWAKDLKEIAGLFREEYTSRTFGSSIALGLKLLSGDMDALKE